LEKRRLKIFDRKEAIEKISNIDISCRFIIVDFSMSVAIYERNDFGCITLNDLTINDITYSKRLYREGTTGTTAFSLYKEYCEEITPLQYALLGLKLDEDGYIKNW
jgi:hypothetical protein